ncbi:MAG TPA: FkbM family methyltransferase [Anaerolineae bacterium]|nr:FkbM family methyltransferase [Anaerolineae bacterium]
MKYAVFQMACDILKAGIGLMGQHTGAVVSARLAEQLAPVITAQTRVGNLRFYCPGHVAFWQAENLLTKEPETNGWIDTFEPGDVMWDIGANVGTYALYTALKSGLTILAFEPCAINYHILNQNIGLNHLEDRISAFCLAFSDVSRLDYLYMASTEFGQAGHTFGESTDWQNQPLSAEFRQATLGFSIDDFVEQFAPPFPNHIKIDVDGIENRIIRGAKKTLADRRLKSLLVELNTDRAEYCQQVMTQLEQAGLTFQAKSHVDMFTSGPLASVHNHLFIRCSFTPP